MPPKLPKDRLAPNDRSFDPDPTELAMLVMTAVSTSASVLALLQNFLTERRRRKEESRGVPPISGDQIFAVEADVERLIANVTIFREFLRVNGIPEEMKLEVGQSTLLTSRSAFAMYDDLFRECLTIARDLHVHGMNLAVRLRGTLAQEDVGAQFQELINNVNKIRFSETFEEFFARLTEDLPAIRGLLREMRDFQRSDRYS